MTDYLERLALLCGERAEELLLALDIDFRYKGKALNARCPVHNGGDYNFYVYPDGKGDNGFTWKCYSHSCDTVWGSSVYGLVKGILSKDIKSIDDVVNMGRVVLTIEEILGVSIMTLESSPTSVENKKFVRRQQIQQPVKCPEGVKFPRDFVRSRLKIPATYYIKRGYSEEILDSYDVGTTDKKYIKGKFNPLYGRALVPIYDDAHEFALGFSGRIIQEDYKEKGIAKWLHSNEQTKSTIFNWWRAKSHIEQSQSAILCEGINDCFKLEMSGIKTSLAVLGSGLSDTQLIRLECSSIRNMNILSNNDEAGNKAAKQWAKQMGRLFNIKRIIIPDKDLDALTVEQTKNIVGEQLI